MKELISGWVESWELYKVARAAGLNVMTSIYVAHGDMTLCDALGDMDVDAECAFIELVGLDACHHRSGSSDDFGCGCRGSQYCNDCIPF